MAEQPTPEPAAKAGRRTTSQKKPTLQEKSAKQAGKARAPTSPLVDSPRTSAAPPSTRSAVAKEPPLAEQLGNDPTHSSAAPTNLFGVSDSTQTGLLPSAADSSRRIDYQNMGSSPDRSSTLHINRSDILAATAPEAVMSESSDVLLAALLNLRLPEAVRHAAHEELLRRSSDGHRYVPRRPSPVVELRPSSPRIPSARPPSPWSSVDISLASVVVAMEDSDGTPIEVSLPRSSPGLPGTAGVQGMQNEADDELEPGVAILTGGAGDESETAEQAGAVLVPAHSAMSVAQACDLVDSLSTSLVIPPPRPTPPGKSKPGTVRLSPEQEARLRTGVRHTPAPTELDNILAACVVISTFYTESLGIGASKSTSRALLDRFDKSATALLSQEQKEKMSKSEQIQLLDRRLATCTVVLAQRYSTYIAHVNGGASKDRLGKRNGAYLDWDALLAEIQPSRPDLVVALERVLPRLASREGDTAKSADCRFLARRDLSLSVQEAVDRIVVSQPEVAYRDAKQVEAVDRSYEAVLCHPAYAETNAMLDEELEDLLEPFEAEAGLRGEVTSFELNIERTPAFAAALRAAHLAAKNEVDGHPPITTGLALEGGRDGVRPVYQNASIQHRCLETVHAGVVEASQRHPQSDNPTKQPNNASLAINDGKNLANVTALLNIASQARLAPKLAPMHDNAGVWLYEAEHGGVAQQATSVLDYLWDRIASPIIEYAARQPPTRRFDEGEQDWTRPAHDSEIHGRTRGHNIGGAFGAKLVSHGGLLVVQTSLKRATGALELEQLPYDISHIRPPLVPPSGASNTDAEKHRDFADANQPWRPFDTSASQADDLREFLDSLDPTHFLQYFLRFMTAENLVTDVQAQGMHTFLATALSLAALSPRPALFAPLVPVMIHQMALQLNDEAQAGRLEVLLSLVEQQYTGSLLGLLRHTDADSFSVANNGPMHDDITKVAILFDLLVNGGTCAGCGRATFAMKEYQPTRSREDEEDRTRALSWTTLSASRVVADVATMQQVVYGRIGGDGWGFSMLGCAFDFKQKNNLSLASRAADKGTTTLGHKRCKVERGRVNAFKAIVGEAVQRVGGGDG